MDRDAFRTHLRTFIAQNLLFSAETELDDSASLLESGLIDSTGAMELIAHVEATVGRTFDDGDLVASNFDSIDRIVAFAVPAQG